MKFQRNNWIQSIRLALILVSVTLLQVVVVQAATAQKNYETLAPTDGTLDFSMSTTPSGGEDFRVTAVSSQIAWGREGTYEDAFRQPRDIEVDAAGNFYISNHILSRVLKFTKDFVFVQYIGEVGRGPGQLSQPNQIVVNDNLLYIPDTDNNRVAIFDTSGVFVRNFGQLGNGDGQFNQPQGVAIDQDGNIYISDTFNHRIQVFSPDGTYLRQWGTMGRRSGEFRYPTHLEFDDNENLFVADSNNNRIQVFDKQGNFIRQMGYRGSSPGRFFIPIGLDIADGYLYVGDTFNNRVQKLTLDGDFVAQWRFGENGSELDKPNGLIVLGDMVYVSDMHHHLVQVYSQYTFTLDDGQEASVNLPAGTYDITQAPQKGWTLDDVTCTGASATDIANGVRVQLTDNITVSCAFANSQ